MWRYITKRIISGLSVIWAVATVVFLGMRAIPGGPVRTMLGKHASPEAVAEVRAKLGLDEPLWVQYLDWLVGLVTFDFGKSVSTGEPIAELIMTAAPRTVSIAVVGIAFGLAVSIPTGILSAIYKGKSVDFAATVTAFLGLSMPAFFIGILLVVFFGVWFNVLPVIGYVPLSEGYVPWLKHILLPGIAVGSPYAAIVMRMTRSSLLEELNEKYMSAARAKGVRSRVRLFKHALQNGLIPVITVAGIQIALILIGSVTVELVFGIRGIGRLFVNSMFTRDYPVVQVVIVLTSVVLVGANLVVDIVYTLVDPRIRYGSDSA